VVFVAGDLAEKEVTQNFGSEEPSLALREVRQAADYNRSAVFIFGMKSVSQLVFWSTLSAIFVSCAAPTGLETQPVSGVLETETPAIGAQVATPVVSLTKETPAPQLTKEVCMSAGGHVEIREIPSELLDSGLQFRVYTPPCYEENVDERYPVLYLVHGQTFNDDQWDRLQADETATQLIAAGEVAPFIIVMPYDRASTQPAVDKFGEAFIEELVPWIDSEYRTIAEREFRVVGGLSRGASWAIHFGLLHPELFSAVGGHSPPVFQEDATKVRGWLDGIEPELMPRFWLDIGERDQRAILDSAIWFEGLLNERDIPHEWYLFAGDHSEEYWSSHVELYLRWYATEW
jgi:enterochelin esterase-like enzyme